MALTWQQTEVTVTEGGTATVTWTESNGMTSASMMIALSQIVVGDSSVATAVWGPNVSNVGGVATGSAIFTGVSAGTTTVTGTTINTEQTNTLTIVVVSADDESYLNKRGLTHFWENIDDIKQDKLTAGAGISITGNTISATGGGTADAVDWGHITGSMSNQTDLTTALAAKANSADLATVATSGSYNDLTNKPTIPTVGNATLTIQKNGTNVQTFTANATSNKTANITVPTKTSDLTNDGADGTSTYVEADDLAAVATSGSYTDLSDRPTIGNATLTIQRNSTSVGTFTANASSNKTINITVPTTAADVSALPASTKYGASITVSLNTTDYKMTTTLKDQDGNTLGAAQTIDLPLESVVVNGSYDNTNKKIVLTLQNGNTIDIPVADLVAGLQSEITSTNKLASDLVDDTGQTHKFMTSAEKTKLSGIAAGAEVNVQSDWNVTSTSSDAFIKNKPTIPTKTSQLTNDSGFITSETEEIFYIGITSVDDVNGTFTADKTFEEILAAINAGQLPVVYDRTTETSSEQTDYVPLSDYFVDDDASEDYISFMRSSINTVSGNNVVAGLGGGVLYFDFQRDRSGGTPVYNYYYANRRSSISSVSSVSPSSTNRQVPGAKLFYDTMATKADTSSLATVATSGSYNDLSNLPTIPTVNNATLTIQRNGTTVKTFTANASSNVTANITVPTDTGDLTNNAGYLKANDVYPVGSIVTFYDTADHSNFLGLTWTRFAAGRMVVGYDSSDADFDTIGETGGEKTHTLTVEEIPKHRHYLGQMYDGYHLTGQTAQPRGVYADYGQTVPTTETGGGQAHNNMPPYITAALWRRTA